MEGAGIDDFFATRRVHFAGVRIHGPRRTRDSLVRGIVERSLADAQADAHDFTPGGDGGDSAAKGGTVTIATVVEALRRSATALHAVPAVSEARFAAVPGSYTQGADATVCDVWWWYGVIFFFVCGMMGYWNINFGARKKKMMAAFSFFRNSFFVRTLIGHQNF